jgi:pimeloyl-ACP methyl ester carboxylesterase
MTRIAILILGFAASALAQPRLAHETVDVNGVKIHYAKAGSGNLILFLHGFPEFWYAWKGQLEEFGRDHLAVAPDMRGFNLSSKPASVDEYRVPILVEDVRALAARLGFGANRKFTLVGHDWGGAVAWAYAIAHPETLDRLVIINGPHPAVLQRELEKNPAQQKASEYMLMFRGPEAEKTLSQNNYAMLVKMVLEKGLKEGYFTEADRKAYLQAWSQPGALTGGLNYYRASRIGPPTADQPKPVQFVPGSNMVNVPTLVIWGEQDMALLLGNIEGLEKYVPKLTIRRIPDATHWVVHEKPSIVSRHIRDFIGP